MRVRVGVALLPEVDPARDDRWARAEAYGFAHAWALDHLAWRALADEPWHATVPVLAAAALGTSSIPLGTFVASPNFRHPVPFAKEVMTLDVMSGGRMTIAVGAGGPGFDAAVLGGPELSPRERADRFEEFVVLLDLLLRQRSTTWSGSWFRAVQARTIPGPLQQPRPGLVVAANGPRGMRLAAGTADGWASSGRAPFGSTSDVWWTGVQDAVQRFDRAAGDVAPADFRRYLDLGAGQHKITSPAELLDLLGRAAELGFSDVVVPWPRPSAPFHYSEIVLERLAERLNPTGELEP